MTFEETLMTSQAIWRETASIRLSETDFQQRWKPAAFFSAMQEAGSHHATRLGFDYSDMMAAGVSWVLLRAKIHFDSFPGAGQTVTIETWPKGIHNKLFFMRDYLAFSNNGNRLAAATCAFGLIDLHARRILPAKMLEGELPNNEGRNAIAGFPEHLNMPAEINENFRHQTTYSDVDLMGHVNNTRYVEWVCDCFSMEFHQQHSLEELQINYRNEIKAGEWVVIQTGSTDDQPGMSFVAGNNLNTGSIAFEAAVRWK